MRKSRTALQPRMAIALLLGAIFSTLLQVDAGAAPQFRKFIFVLAFASGCFAAYEALRMILQKNLSQRGDELARETGVSPLHEFLLLLLTTALFATFLAVDHGIIYRLRAFNILMFFLSMSFAVNAAWKVARKSK